MRELHAAGWIELKAILFLCAGTLAIALLLADRPALKILFLLAVAIWSFCRAYYFAFYVLERYVDPGFRFSGLASLVRYFAARPAPRK
jgi:hypothetical protein